MTIKESGSGYDVSFKFSTEGDKRLAFQQTEQMKEFIKECFESCVYIRFEKSNQLGTLDAYFSDTSVEEIKSSLNNLFPCIFVKA